MADADAHGLLLAFDTDSGDFARGFEAGRLWELLRADPDIEITEQIHATNAEMVIRMAESCGRPFSAVDVDQTWVLVTLGPAEQLQSP